VHYEIYCRFSAIIARRWEVLDSSPNPSKKNKSNKLSNFYCKIRPEVTHWTTRTDTGAPIWHLGSINSRCHSGSSVTNSSVSRLNLWIKADILSWSRLANKGEEEGRGEITFICLFFLFLFCPHVFSPSSSFTRAGLDFRSYFFDRWFRLLILLLLLSLSLFSLGSSCFLLCLTLLFTPFAPLLSRPFS